MYTQAILNLLLVLGLAAVYLLITWKLKKIKNTKGQTIEIISTLAITPKEKILLLKVEGRKILIGATSSNISVLSIMNEEANSELPVGQSDQFIEKMRHASKGVMLETELQ